MLWSGTLCRLKHLFLYNSCFLQIIGPLASQIESLQTHLWVGVDSGIFETPQQSAILSKIFLSQKAAPLTISSWRHVCVAICDQYLKQQPRMPDAEGDGDGDDDDNIIDLQRNHSSRTANRAYGGTTGYSLDHTTEVMFKQASEVWQEFWGVSESFFSPWRQQSTHHDCIQINWGYAATTTRFGPGSTKISPKVLGMQALQQFTKNPDAIWKSPF